MTVFRSFSEMMLDSGFTPLLDGAGCYAENFDPGKLYSWMRNGWPEPKRFKWEDTTAATNMVGLWYRA